MYKIYSLLIIILFSCSTRINYLGTSEPPTKHVDVFVDASAIKKPYTIMGKGYQGLSTTMEVMQQKAINLAMEKGADAVLFQDYFITDEPATAYDIAKTDSTGKTLSAKRRNETSSVVSSRINILFLKYN